ncbi:calcium-independent phospholipase A2-gamma-like isoform X1 [Dunckerocampus dactyliophorus]|uniref:calcium-independent phospholipase A2-gamma-like isoform X1 n=1 Tax=Dunckerocampus dactyliophorus TaxID=161453 RepID=UPI00240648CE|nr:calcium-independent phospholipase A2-gamma-like isoform X1 [Dunckerocampus dactyliophorus]
MGRYISINLRSLDRNSYCKMRYLIVLFRTSPVSGCEPLHLRRYSSSSPLHRSRFARQAIFTHLNLCNDIFLRDFSKQVKNLQIARCNSSSNRGAIKAEAPIGIIEVAQNSYELTSLGGRLGQSFNRLSRHINIYFKKKDTVPVAENGSVVATTPTYIGRTQRQRQHASGKITMSESKDTTAPLKDNQLFHISSLATRFGESYNYVASHINSVFSQGFAKVRVPEKEEIMSSTRGPNSRQKRRKIHRNCIINSTESETSQLKSSFDQATVEANHSNNWEDSYRHFARHINKYFGAKVADDATLQNQGESTTQSTSQKYSKEPIITPETGLFHSSHNSTNFGENHMQMSSHINQYFKGASRLEDTSTNLQKEMNSLTADRKEAVSFMDCFRHPTRAIPDLLEAYLSRVASSQTRERKPAMKSARAGMNKKKQAEELIHGLIQDLRQASSAKALTTCVEALNEYLINHPSHKALMWQEKTAVTLLRQRRVYRSNQALQSAIREALALIGYVDPIKGRGIRVLSIDGGGTR